MSSSETARWRAMNDPVIKQFRETGGQTSRKYPVILLTTTGRKTGKPRVTPLNFTEDGDRISVIGSKGGSATHPSWFLNLLDDPIVTIEHGGETYKARARVAEEPERTRLFDKQAKAMPFFHGYRKRVKAREIPVVVFERIGDG